MDFSNLKFCQPTDKRRNMQPYRFLSTAMNGDTKTVDFPCVHLNGHKVEENVKNVNPIVFQANDFFKKQSVQGCHTIPVIIGGFVSSESTPVGQIPEATCQKLAALSHNIIDSFSKRNFSGLNIAASYIFDNFKSYPNLKSKPNTSQVPAPSKSTGSEPTKGTLISDHSADSFRCPQPNTSQQSYANIARSACSTPRQSYAEITKMTAGKSPCGRGVTPQRQHKRNSYFNRNNAESHRRYSDKSNWRDRSEMKDLRRDRYEERKPRYVVEKHPNFDKSNRVEESCDCNNWRCRKHPQKSSPKQETIRRMKDTSFESLSKRFSATRLNNVCVPSVVREEVKVAPQSVETCEASSKCAEPCSEVGIEVRRASECESEDSFVVFASDSEDSDDEEDDYDAHLREVNARWRRQNPGPAPELTPAKVRFTMPAVHHQMVCWGFAYRAARCGPWEQMARDRERFRQRVLRSQPLLAAVFDPDNRRRAQAVAAST